MTFFGIPNDERDPIINQFNFTMLMARYQIYWSKKARQKLDTYKFLLECKKYLHLEKQIIAARGEIKKFYDNWQDFLLIYKPPPK